MTKIKGTMQEQLALEKEYKKLAEHVLRKTYEQAATENRAGSTKVGGKLMEHVFTECSDNVRAVLYPSTKRGVVPAYQGVVNQLQDLYAGQEEMLVKTCVVTLLNKLIGATLHCEGDTHLVFDALVNSLVQDLIEEFKGHEYTQNATRNDAAFFEEGLKQRVQDNYKIQYAHKAYKDMKFTPTEYDKVNMHKLVVVLVDAIIKGSGYFEYYIVSEYRKGSLKQKKTLRAADWLLEAWSKSIDIMAFNNYKFNPCVVPPKPWTSVFEGGYYGANAPFSQFIRVNFKQKNVFMRHYLQKLEQLDLSWLFDCVNALQETPFIINDKILNTMIAIMENHGGLGGLPRTDETPKVPLLVAPTEEELKAHKKRLVAHYKDERARISKVLRTNSTLGTAKKYSVYERIYFPWNLDYRGRIYPMCPSLNPQGDDAQKALLLFADPTPLASDEDLKWLYIAGAGFAGLDKIPFSERETWVLDHEEQILQSAKDPLTYTWWDEIAGDESPMLFLSFCFEFQKLREYQVAHGGSAVGFKTGLPISFDGTCSGLQHFSMLLADEVGGNNVNLVPDEVVHDIYQVVADKVNVVLHHDAVSGTEDTYKTDKKTGEEVLDSNGNKCITYGTKELAMEWLAYASAKFGSDGIKRKVCKRSVMTLAYGSRQYGFSENLKEDIIKPWVSTNKENPIFLSRSQAANYMAKLIWDAVTTTVVKAVEGMEWLKKIASMIGKHGEAVAWVSPNGLPIQQNKFRSNTEMCRMRFNGGYIRLYIPRESTDIDPQKQAQGIAPNFIHSLDASHMQRVIMNQAEKGNKNFFMIHDSFGSDLAHAGDLFTSIRTELVKMYKDHNYLEEWLQDVEYLLPTNKKTPTPPTKGNLNLDEVVNSKYCFA
ncbi:DNA-directed RNA polymerase [uncultured Megasphaera sp.]|uniref:DNA-directed RNA polymerase n=1 Tax=uncultured Megasphaera sp. TaxID=165188 RepID=UPI002594F300|nr:DNA-directed RNA polymerase [uncultured Megasphaera sp.]